MPEPNEYFAYFTVTGDFDPDEITQRVDTDSSDSWKKGDAHPRRRLERKFSRWCLNSRLPRSEPLETHIADVLAQLGENPEAFKSLVQSSGGWIQLVAYLHEAYPGLNFDAQLIQGLARFGLSVDFDFYFLWSDAREDTE